MLEHIDQGVEVNEGVIHSDNTHFARVTISPGDQVTKTTRLVYSNLHHHVSRMCLALH